MPRAARPDTASHDRHFYARKKAFGRFGMRIFKPSVMETPHWHGHVEINVLRGAAMTYQFDGETIEVAPDRMVVFWAGIPHQLTDIRPTGDGAPELANLYMPVDAFLFLPHIAPLQVAFLGGAIATLPAGPRDHGEMERWYADYRSGDYERLEVMKTELNTLLRRALLGDIAYLRRPVAEADAGRTLISTHIGHVVAMVRFILDNLADPMTNADVTGVTGLHQNYALSLFSRTMRVPLKRFIIRMRLIRARALLLESNMAISTVAETSGFTSISQFYQHFKAGYGMSPHALRMKYTAAILR